MTKKEKDEILNWIKEDFWSSFIKHVAYEYYIKGGMKTYDRKYDMKSYDEVFCAFDRLFVDNGKIEDYTFLHQMYGLYHIENEIKKYNSLYDYIKYRRALSDELCKDNSEEYKRHKIVGEYLLLRYFNYFQCNNDFYKQGDKLKKTEYKKKINGIDCINNYDDFVKQSNDYLKKISEDFYNKYFQKYEK